MKARDVTAHNVEWALEFLRRNGGRLTLTVVDGEVWRVEWEWNNQLYRACGRYPSEAAAGILLAWERERRWEQERKDTEG